MINSAAAAEVSKNHIRDRALAFSKRWSGTTSEQGEKQSFWNEFFEVFGIKRRQVAIFEEQAERATTGNIGWIDLLFPGQMAVEHKSAGKNLDDAMGQLIDYLPALHKSAVPWLLVVSDFESFSWRNLDDDSSGSFRLDELVDNLDLFWWIAGHGTPGAARYDSEEDVNLVATKLLQVLHDELAASGYPTEALREWLTRILFCLFADDTDVWDRAAFHVYIAHNTRVDGSDLGRTLAEVFQVLDTSPAKRPTGLDEDLAAFAYINGDLFEAPLPIAVCSEQARDALLAACGFNWSAISPAIFGSMFQNVMTAEERHELGAHYTTEQNILRTIRPLFLDELEADLERADSAPKLREFHERLGDLTFFDPACGCGNFLVIAYREIRRLETETLRRLAAKDRHGTEGQRSMSLELLCKVTVDQFYGIELEEFPARIARTAMYLIDHMANRVASVEFGEHYVRFPIPASPHIHIGNALTEDWGGVLPAEQATYVFGNPPFLGQKARTPAQTEELRAVWGDGYARWLDYVTGWYRRAVEYAGDRAIRFAFVSTNSVTQGEQAARLWRPLINAGFKIDFAWRTFEWTSEASGRAHVHVVIIGFSKGQAGPASRRIYSPGVVAADAGDGPTAINTANITPYLTPGPTVIVDAATKPVSPAMPPAIYGNKPADGGGLIVTADERAGVDPVAEKYLRTYVGARELIHDEQRWCLWMPGGPEAGDVKRSPFLQKRLAKVQDYRTTCGNPDTEKYAAQPYRFFRIPQPAVSYIGIPRHVSANRRWFTVKHFQPDVIASDAIYTAVDPDGFLFGLLSSTMFIAWLRAIGGRIKSDLRFSNTIVHNPFPLPADVTAAKRAAVIETGKKVITARASHPGTSLADLYDPLATPPNLVDAHRQLDHAVDAVFATRRNMSTELERLEVLLEHYQALTAPLTAASRRRR